MKTRMILSILLLISAIGLAHAAPTLRPQWVDQRPDLPDAYWGIGEVFFDGATPTHEEKQIAYLHAAAELSTMIGQRIVTSFSNTKRESGDGVDYDFQEDTVAKIESMSQKRLSGVRIRDEWTDESGRSYHVWISIPAAEVNAQIKDWAATEEKALREVLEEGIAGLEGRVGAVEAQTAENASNLESLEDRLTRLLAEVASHDEKLELLAEEAESDTGPRVQAHGFGRPSAGQPATLARQNALRAARIDAKRNLLAMVVALEQESATVLADDGIRSDVVIERMRGRIQGARQVGQPIDHEDGVVEVVMEVELDHLFEQ